METVFILGVTSFLFCMAFTPLCRNLAVKLRLVDSPDQHRKFHAKPIPRLGGVPIVLAYAGSLGVVLALLPSSARLHIQHHELLWSLLPATAVVFLTGLLDDLIGLRPWQKLLGQLIGASWAISVGSRLTTSHSALFSHHPLLGSPWVTIPASMIWLLCCTNALNLIDGLDGLASGVGLFAAVTTLLAAVFTGNTGLVLATMPLVGCLLAFLYFNFSPASIFLGDSGSLTIGFMLGCFGLVWGQRGGALLGMTGPLIALALPLIDVALAICRRFLRRVPIFQGDRGHIHHMVLARGFKPRETALILYAVCAIAASLALLQSFNRPWLDAVIILVFIVLVWAGVNYLGYVELSAARSAVSRKRVLRHVRDEIYLKELGRSLAQAQHPEACWHIVLKVCLDMEFDVVSMRFAGEDFSTPPSDGPAKLTWDINLPLDQSGYLVLGRISPGKPPQLLMAVIERLQESLSQRIRKLNPASVALKGVQSRTPYLKPNASSERV